MAEVTCRYCGEAFQVELAPGQSAEALALDQRVCGACFDRAPSADADGTVMLAPESANRLGHSLAPSEPEPQRTPRGSGRTFGSYGIIEEISRGSFGVVYRARQKGLDRIVALKVLLAGAHASPDMVARFQREARAAARVKHPCIVPIYDIGSEDEHHYFAMEFIEGESLSTRIARGGLSIPEALTIAEDLADAMNAAHAQGVVHRDLKPSNIILDATGRPHITDFGLAKQVDLDTRYTQSGTTLGTPAYMPPEQARGEVESVDARSDVYALGAILYEMLTGSPPFGGRSLLEVVVAVLNEPVRPPRQVNPKIHRDVQTIVLKCLEKVPAQRYASASELCDDIRRFRSGEAIRARPIGPVRLVGRFMRRHGFFFLAVATVLLAVSVSWWHVRNMQKQLIEEKNREQQARELRERIEQQKEIKSTQAEWKPFWWTPENLDENVPPEDRLVFRQGFQPAKGPVPDWAAGRAIVLSPNKALVSPEERRIFGDLEARIRFRLSPQAAGLGVRMGIQSFEGGLPFVLAIRPGRLTLIGPTDLYTTGNQARSPLVVKAEKEGPVLIAGVYQLTVRREGLNLSFNLQPPEGLAPVQLTIWDLALSHWKLKYTQVTIREAPDGFAIIDTMVLRKSVPERVDDLSQALNNFHDGEYKGAEINLDAIIEKQTLEEKDPFKMAQAAYYLGLIQEICQPLNEAEARYYARALDTLLRCPNTHESRSLEARVRLRRLISFARQGKWARAEDERLRLATLAADLPAFPPPVPGIGEPFAWELVPLLTAISMQRNDAEARELALALFKLLGLSPGSEYLARSADVMGRYLVSARRYDDLIALHKAFATPALLPAFSEAIDTTTRSGARARAFELLDYALHSFPRPEVALEGVASLLLASALNDDDLDMATRVLDLLPRSRLAAAFREFLDRRETAPPAGKIKDYLGLVRRARLIELGVEERKAMTASVVRLAERVLAESRWQDLCEIHTAWPTTDLAPILAQAVMNLAALPTADAENEALALLRYAYAQKLRDSMELQAAVLQFARRGSEGRTEDANALILSVHRAFPTPKLLDLADDAMRDLVARKTPEQALSFFGSARVEFGREAVRLQPYAVDLLRALPQDQASKTLNELREVVGKALQGKPSEADWWQMECADLSLAIGRTDKATELWSELAAAERMDPELIARVTLRLCGWNLAQGQPLPPEIWAPTMIAEETPEEARLLARFVTGTLVSQELELMMQRLAEPHLFSEAEWDVGRALRARAEGRDVEANRFLWSAADKAGTARAWPHYLLDLLRNRTP